MALLTDTQRYSLFTSPVSLSRTRSSDRIFTNAIHDTGASYSFLEISLAKRLALTGVGTPLVLNTFGNSKRVDSAVAVQVHLWGVKGESFGVINALVLPEFADVRAYDYDHLQGIDIPSPVDDGSCHLLLGNNCGTLLAPLQKARMNGTENEPIAVQTSLGWSVTGPTVLSGSTSDDQDHEKCKLLMFEKVTLTE